MVALKLLANNLFVIVVFTLLQTKKTIQSPIKGASTESEIKTLTANKGGDVSIPCKIEGDPSQTKSWYKVGYKNIEE